MKKVAVCGYTSNVGRCFIERYKDQYEFVLIGRNENANVFLDLNERKLKGNSKLLCECESLINFSAHVNDASDQEILDLMSVNVLGALFLAETARKYNMKRFVHMSSISATYDVNDSYYGFYAQSKKSADEILSLYCKQNDVKLCILRPVAVFGDDAFASHQKLLYGLIDKVKKGENICIYGKKDACRNYIHVNTLSDILYGVIEKNITGIYEVVGKKNEKLTEIIDGLNKFYGGNSTVEFLADKPDVIGRSFVTSSEIFEKTGVPMATSVYDELKKYESREYKNEKKK